MENKIVTLPDGRKFKSIPDISDSESCDACDVECGYEDCGQLSPELGEGQSVCFIFNITWKQVK